MGSSPGGGPGGEVGAGSGTAEDVGEGDDVGSGLGDGSDDGGGSGVGEGVGEGFGDFVGFGGFEGLSPWACIVRTVPSMEDSVLAAIADDTALRVRAIVKKATPLAWRTRLLRGPLDPLATSDAFPPPTPTYADPCSLLPGGRGGVIDERPGVSSAVPVPYARHDLDPLPIAQQVRIHRPQRPQPLRIWQLRGRSATSQAGTSMSVCERHFQFAPCRLGVAGMNEVSSGEDRLRIGIRPESRVIGQCPRGRPGQGPGLSHRRMLSAAGQWGSSSSCALSETAHACPSLRWARP